MQENNLSIPFWEKYALNITEATKYFHIGEKKLRKIIDENLNTGFVLQNGSKMLIKRKKLEEFLNETTSI